MKSILFGAVSLGLLLATPQTSLGAPPRKAAVKKGTHKVRTALKRSPVKARTEHVKKKKKGPVFHFGPMNVTAGPEKPQAVYMIPKARVRYTRPKHEQEILGWIMRSMRIR